MILGRSCEKENLDKAAKDSRQMRRDSQCNADCAGGRRCDRRQETAVRHLGQRRKRGLQDGLHGRAGRDSSYPGGARYTGHQRISAHLPRTDPGQREGQYDNLLPGRTEGHHDT